MDKPYVISAFLGAFVNLIINMLLIPCYGSIGASIGTFFAEFVVCIYQSYKASLFIPVVRYVKLSLPFVLLGIVMYCLLLSFEISTMPLVVLSIKIIIGVLIYFIVLYGILYVFNRKMLIELKKEMIQIMKLIFAHKF